MTDESKHMAEIIDAGFEKVARQALAKRLKPIIDEIIADTINDVFGELRGVVKTERSFTRESVVKILFQDRRKQ